MNLRIIKVRANDDGVAISYQQKSGKSWSKITLESPEKARPELYEALKALVPHVVTVCEFPPEYNEDITVSGASFSFDEDLKTYGASIVAKKKLSHSNSPFNIITPHKFERRDDSELKGDALVFLSTGCANDLRILREEAKAYIKGERAQQELFTSDKVPAAEPENVIPTNGKPGRKTRKKEEEVAA